MYIYIIFLFSNISIILLSIILCLMDNRYEKRFKFYDELFSNTQIHMLKSDYEIEKLQLQVFDLNIDNAELKERL